MVCVYILISLENYLHHICEVNISTADKGQKGKTKLFDNFGKIKTKTSLPCNFK